MCFLSLHLSGEVPGLYSPEELEPLLSPLKDAASQDGFTGPLYNYFSFSQSRVPLDWPLCVSACVFVLVLVGREFLCAHYCVRFPAVLLYNALRKHRSVGELESAACESNQKATYFKIKPLSSALLNSCSDRPPMFPLCPLAVQLGSICALTGPC